MPDLDDLNHHIQFMYDRLSDADGCYSSDDILAAKNLLSSLSEGRVSFRVEPWHVFDHAQTNYASHIAELLFDARTAQHKKVDFQKADALFRELGCGPEIDELILKTALHKCILSGVNSVSVNVGMDTLNCPVFWENVTPLIEKFGPQNLVIEILEHAVPDKPDLSGMLAMKEKGVRFAIDDFVPCDRDWARLDLLAEHISFLKLDGKYLDQVQNTPFFLKTTLDKIAERAPHVAFVAEWVDDIKEAQTLSEIYSGVNWHFQGRDLPPWGHEIDSPSRAFAFAI